MHFRFKYTFVAGYFVLIMVRCHFFCFSHYELVLLKIKKNQN